MIKEKVKLALEALEKADAVIYSEYCGTDREELQICEPAIKALEEVLSEQEQGEPVGEVVEVAMLGINSPAGKQVQMCVDLPVGTKFYTTPQQRTWVELTKGDIEKLWASSGNVIGYGGLTFENIRAVEAACREKNT